MNQDVTPRPPSPAGKSVGYLKREEIVGKQVISSDAVVIGTVKDVAVSLDGKAALQVLAKDGADGDSFVYSEDIQAVGDVILLRYPSTKERGESSKPELPAPIPPPPLQMPIQSSNGKKCSKCGYLNTPNSHFCIKCGEKLLV